MKNLVLISIFLFSFAAIAENRLDLSDEAIRRAIKSMEKENAEHIPLGTNQKVIIKVSHNSVLSQDWAYRICKRAATALNDIYGTTTESHCFLEDSEHPETKNLINNLISKEDISFELDLTRNLDMTIDVALTNLKQTDRNFTNKVGWKIAYSTEDNFQYDLKDRLSYSYFAINNLSIIRDSLVHLIYKSENPNFKKGETLTRDQMYLNLQKSKRWNKDTRKFLTAGSELIASLSFGWYGYNYLSTNQQDFDYNREKVITTFENKFTGGSMVRYDDNSWNTNQNHVYAGVTYYLECRGAGFTALQSYLCAIAGSTAWEAVIEWREVFSINDQIFTATGGAILGESLHQLGMYIDQKAPSWFRNSIGWAWRGPKKAVQGYDKIFFNGESGDLDTEDPLLNGKFEFEIGTVKMSNGVMEKRIGISSDVNTIPFYVGPGHEVRFIKDVVETNFSFNGPSSEFAQNYDLFAKVVLAAYYNKNISEDQRGRLNGYSFYVGPSSALDLRNDHVKSDDFMGIVHVIGSTAKLVNFYKGFKITSTLDIWGDSVMMKSMMIEDYKSQNPNKEIVGNLASADYFHGFGVTSKGQVVVEYGKWAVGATIENNSAENTNSRQRKLEKELTNLNIAGSRLDAEIFVERTITSNFKIKFAVSRTDRSEAFDGIGTKNTTNYTQKISLVYYF